MCLMQPKIPTPAPIANMDNRESALQQTVEARLRRRRAGAAANILTSPTGLPAAPRMGEVA